MAAESERTHRGMIETYNSDVESGMLSAPSGSTVLPTGRGVYKARLFGALFMAMALAKSSHSQAEIDAAMIAATDIALLTLKRQGVPRLDQEEAKSFRTAYLTSVNEAMVAAFDLGPLPPLGFLEQPELLALADHLHDVRELSRSDSNVTQQRR